MTVFNLAVPFWHHWRTLLSWLAQYNLCPTWPVVDDKEWGDSKFRACTKKVIGRHTGEARSAYEYFPIVPGVVNVFGAGTEVGITQLSKVAAVLLDQVPGLLLKCLIKAGQVTLDSYAWKYREHQTLAIAARQNQGHWILALGDHDTLCYQTFRS